MQVPIEISVQACDDVSNVIHSPDSEPYSGRQSQCSDSLQVPLSSSMKMKRAQLQSASPREPNQEIPDWAKKLAAQYNKPIEQVNFDSQV